MISGLLALNAKCFYWSILSLEVLNEIYAEALVLTFMCDFTVTHNSKRVKILNTLW